MSLIIIFPLEDVELVCRASPENGKRSAVQEAAKATQPYGNTGETQREDSSEGKGESNHA